ncbi:hypothetical protein [Granulicella tundricola]|uniref:hypothetical protein n=1 Tax=Granulicella tundricola TaxID=940615 RepID=UPI0001DB74D2|nr:hypothetical protein [Granulicella tundricola]
MIPRSNKHWSFPFEVGFQYIAEPTVVLNLTGSACSADGCGSIDTDPETQANIVAERKELSDDLAPLRFYPILSTGVSYRFGR